MGLLRGERALYPPPSAPALKLGIDNAPQEQRGPGPAILDDEQERAVRQGRRGGEAGEDADGVVRDEA
jgi:hypothetical protein